MNWKPLVVIGLCATLLLALITVGLLHLLGSAGIYVTAFHFNFTPTAYVLLAVLAVVGLATYFIFRKRRTLG